ncbi:ankyrin repeat domain-containing protein [Undibacterium sp. LX40W]|uniref:Ankyrin repeat domain-containing protein n=1 Tax=Undibacterium nitidum TaxID=2762298 RepID=A0A923KV78_9BURK|nr:MULTISPECIES: ankyrin repeat domain-containing protein [Undibacterium]MBC3882887.1 ankyrin repeat domain-containing protein [Undibacterium nitidum]MBC3893168.1 ankyrin repeat domain-containing protein [Undibacterium sp. LX40W]
MKKPSPILVLLLVFAIGFAIYLKVSNPHKKYSQQAFWETATLADVTSIPEEALKPGNKNGPVLMWAATTTKDPAIISALVARGASVNERDAIFSGTPLSAAAGYSQTPAVIDELVRLGAEIDSVVGTQDKTPLIIAAEINPHTPILDALVKNGASTTYQDKTGRNAHAAAIKFGTPEAVEALRRLSK